MNWGGGFNLPTPPPDNSNPGSGVCIPAMPLFYWLGSNLGKVVYSHCLYSLLSSKKLGYKREYLDWTDLTCLIRFSALD